MTIDEQKESVAKQICLYLADLLGNNTIKTETILDVAKFLNMGVESAKEKKDLTGITDGLKISFPNLPSFELQF